MKIINRLVTALALCSILIQPYAVFAEDAEVQEAEVQNTEREPLNDKYQESLDIVTQLGIMSGDMKENYDSTVTRADFAAMIGKIMFYNTDTSSSNETNMTYVDQLYETVFNGEPGIYDDVTVSDSYYEVINSLKNMDVMIGFDGMFRPEDNITYYETVKTLMSMIGYTAFVNDTDPYPGEYLKIANNEGMTKNLLDKSQHDLTAAEVALLIYNTLHMDIVVMNLTGDKISYTIEEGVTPLNKYMDIYRSEGLVDSTTVSSLYGDVTGGDIIKINEEAYSGDIYRNYIGRYVDFYYTDRDRKIVAMKKARDVNELELFSYEIENDNFDDRVYLYTENNGTKTRRAKVAADAIVLYNGRGAKDKSGDELYLPKNGKVELIDNNNDDTYDVLFVWDYETYVVNAVSTAGVFTAIDYYTNEQVTFEEDAGYELMVVDTNGDAADLSNVEKWDVLSVATSEGYGEYLMTVIISKDKVIGQPVYSDDYVTIDGVEYPLSSVFDDTKMDKNPKDRFTFSIDAIGQIAAYDIYSGDIDTVHIGFFAKLLWEENSDNPPKVRIFSSDGNWNTFQLRKKLTLDDYKMKNSIWLTENDNNLRDQTGSRPQMIEYKINKNNEIYWIGTLPVNVVDKDGTIKSTPVYYNTNLGKYEGYSRSFGDGTYAIRKDCILFKIPYDTDAGKAIYDVSREKDYSIVIDTQDKFIDQRWDEYVQFFNVSKAGSVKYMAWYQPEGSSSFTSEWERCVVVDSVSVGLNEDDEQVAIINGYQAAAAEFTMEVAEEITDQALKLKKGDIITYGIDGKGKIGLLTVRYKADGDNEYFYENSCSYGTIAAVDYEGGIFKTNYGNGNIVGNMNGTTAYMPEYLTTAVMVYDRKDNTVTAGTFADVIEGKEVFVHWKMHSPMAAIVFK